MRDRLSFRIGIAVFALLMAASLPVRADYRSAVSAYENGAYEAALGEFRTLAQSGDPAAQYHLGLMFEDGRGVRKDPVAALGWFICAAGSDGQAGTDAAISVEQLSSALDRASVSAAQERARNCRATAETPAPQRTGAVSERPGGTGEKSGRPDGTGEESERPGITNRLDWETLKDKLSQFFFRCPHGWKSRVWKAANPSLPRRSGALSGRGRFFFPRMEPSWVPNMSLGSSARGICSEI